MQHEPSLVECPANVWKEMQIYMDGLKALAAQHKQLVFFYERNISHQYANPHCHIQAIPISAKAAAKVPKLLKGWKVLPSNPFPFEELKRVATGAYFWFEVDGNLYLNASDTINEDLEYGRKLYVEITGLPTEMGRWKSCLVSKDKETRMTETFVENFKDFDKVMEQ
jgi:hypothetical protein